MMTTTTRRPVTPLCWTRSETLRLRLLRRTHMGLYRRQPTMSGLEQLLRTVSARTHPRAGARPLVLVELNLVIWSSEDLVGCHKQQLDSFAVLAMDRS